MLDVLRRSAIPHALGSADAARRPSSSTAITRPFGLAEYPLHQDERRRRLGDIIFWIVIVGASGFVAVSGILYLNAHLGFSHFPSLIALGFATFARFVVLLVVSTIIWVPVGSRSA